MASSILGFDPPTARVAGVQIASIDLQKVDLVFDVLIENTSSVSFPLIGIKYELESNGRKLVSGNISDAKTIQANSSTTIRLPVTLVFQDILSTFFDIKPGSVIPYKVKIENTVKLPIVGDTTIPFEHSGEIPVPSVPIILLERIQFKKFTFEESVIILHLKIKNLNEFELALKSLEYEISLSGHKIGGAGIKQSEKVEKGGTASIQIPHTFRPIDFASAIWDMIGKMEVSYGFKGSVSVDTPFGPMNFPFGNEGTVPLIK